MRLPVILPLPLTASHARSVVLLLLLMLFSAFTEGFGLLLLVPMLGVLGGSLDGADRVTGALASLGVPLSLNWLLALFVTLVLLRALVNYARTVQSFRLEIAVVDGLRARAWSALLHCDWRQLSTMQQTENASLLISNIDRVGYGIGQALRGLAIAITLGGLGLAALAISPQLAIAAIAVGTAVLLAYRGIRRRAALLGEELNRAYARVYAGISETLGALRVIKSFGKEDSAAETGVSAFAGLRRTQFAYIRDAGLAQIALQAGGALLLAVLVWFAIGRWNAGPAQILPLVALFARALPQLEGLQTSWQEWAHSRPAVSAAMGLIETAEASREPVIEAGRMAPELSEALVLEGVSVSFEGRNRAALADVSLTFPAGSITAIIGASGAGKSTLTDLIGGLIAPDRGAVLIDGVRLEDGLRRAWRERVTYVQQEPVLFTGTIRENLLWANPLAGQPRLEEVLGRASAAFVHDLPDGLDTRIGEGGHQLSGGERQRLVLARALLREPSLLILDEASSALDSENEAAIARAVSQLRGRMTIVIVGHRGVLGELAERHIRLESGRVVSLEG